MPFPCNVSNPRDDDRMMKVELRLYATLQSYLPEKGEGNLRIVEVSDGTTVQDFLQKFAIPAGAVKVIFINGIHAKGDEVLKEGDRVGAFPPVAGG